MDENILSYLSGNINFTDFIEKFDSEIEHDVHEKGLVEQETDGKGTETPKKSEFNEREKDLSWEREFYNDAEQQIEEPAQLNVPKEIGKKFDNFLPIFEKLKNLLPSLVSNERKRKANEAEENGDIDAKKVFKKSKLLPYPLRIEMGKANVLLAKGELEKAKDICLNVVRQAPRNVQPFHTLAVIHEEMDDEEKAVQYSLISAYIECRDASEWHELGRRCYRLGNIKQAAMCLTKACSYDKTNIGYRWERACFYIESHDYQRAINEFSKLLKIIPDSDKQLHLEISKDIAKAFHRANAPTSALKTLRNLLEKFPDIVDLEVVNMLGELLITTGEYHEAFQIISTYCGISSESTASENLTTENKEYNIQPNTVSTLSSLVDINEHDSFSFATSFAERLLTRQNEPTEESASQQIHTGVETDHSKEYVDLDTINRQQLSAEGIDETISDRLEIPHDMPVDLIGKIIVCVIHLKRNCDLTNLLDCLLRDGIEAVGDLILDIADALAAVGSEDMAIKYLTQLTETKSYNKAAVWLKLGDCQNICGLSDEAIKSYQAVLKLAPNQLSTRSELAKIYSSLGRQEEAMAVLADCEELYNENIDKEVAGNMIRLEDFKVWYHKCMGFYSSNSLENFAKTGYFLFSNYFSTSEIQSENIISKTMMWEIFRKLLSALVELNYNERAASMIDRAQRFRSFGGNKEYRKELDLLNVYVLFLNKRYDDAFTHLRGAIMKADEDWKRMNSLWNFYNCIGVKLKSNRGLRFVLGMLSKQPKCTSLIMLNGNNAHVSGSYVFALGEYMRVFQAQPKNPLICLMIGITFINMAVARYTQNRQSCVMQGMSFIFLYFHYRGKTQESYFNVGRAFHQLGLQHFACHYYQESLKFRAASSDSAENYEPSSSCLHQETAYNLSKIYRASGNNALAMRILLQYCQI